MITIDTPIASCSRIAHGTRAMDKKREAIDDLIDALVWLGRREETLLRRTRRPATGRLATEASKEEKTKSGLPVEG